jgi:hypothetical protein
MPTILSSRHGYAARRGSRAGSALAVREGRAPSPQGPAENGLPPATRGKRQGIGPPLSFHAPNGAPDVPVRHTRGPGLADASASSAGMAAVRKGVKLLSVGKDLKARSCTAKNRNGPSRKPAADIHGLRPLQRDRSRRQKPLNGALKGVTYTKPYEAASSAPSDALTNPRAQNPPRGYRCWRRRAGQNAKIFPFRENMR